VARWCDTAGVGCWHRGRARWLQNTRGHRSARGSCTRSGTSSGSLAIWRRGTGGLAKNGSPLVTRFAPGKPLDGKAHFGDRVGCRPPAGATNATTAGLDDARNPVPARNRRLRLLHGPRFPVTWPRTGRVSCAVQPPSLSDWIDHFFDRRECPRGGYGDGS
jgi:hypothetical protein